MNYFGEGNLRSYLEKNHETMSLKEKVFAIWRICFALSDIHAQDLVHYDLHSGNILLYTNRCLIADLGLCGPVDDDNVRKLYGIVPYMAPELFLLQKYTKASDIYSVGMLMWEIFGGFPPFNDIPHDLSTISNIISGLRPPMLSEIPNEIQSLIKRCWNGDPSKRPTIEEILDVIKYQYRQILETEELSIAYDNEKKTYSGSRKANKPTNQTYHTSRILSLSEKDINKFVIPEDFDDENVDWE